MVIKIILFYLILLFFINNNVYGQQLTNISGNVIGIAGNSTIWYQSDTNNYFSWGNIQNPITISITYNSGTPNSKALVCLNSFAQSFPISGVDLNITCPSGSVGIVANSSQILLPSQKNNNKIIKDNTIISSNETISANVYVKPTNEGGFIVTIPENNSTQKFQISYSGIQCDNGYYPIGSNSSNNICLEIESIYANTKKIVNIPAQSWQYYQFNTDLLSNNSNAIYVYYNNSDTIKLYTQSGYYPTESWYIPTYDKEESNNMKSSRILTPGLFGQSETFFFGIYNSDDSSVSVTINITVTTCTNNTVFGNNCDHYSGDNINSESGVYIISGKLIETPSTNLSASISNNNGNAFMFSNDDDDYEGNYSYFAISEYPNYNTPYYIRISVANNNVKDDNGAPGLYVKRGGYPSAQSNHYNASTIGDVVHQVLIQIDDEDLSNPIISTNTWYFAVQLPCDFSVWVGSNCAGNCNDQQFGYCMCNSQTCESLTINFTNPSAFYQRPNSILDSGGACNCIDDDYDKSFNCSEMSYPNFWIWITLICILVTFLLIVAIGVPILCFLLNRKKQYDIIDYDE